MKALSEIKKILYEQMPYLKENYGVVQIGIFGSYARMQQNENSDLDLAVNLIMKICPVY